MSNVPQGLAGTSTSGTPTTLSTVDSTQAAPVVNTTARDVQPAASVSGTSNVLTGDASTARIRTGAGFFRFIADGLYFPWGQRLRGRDVRAAGIGQPAWFFQSLLAQLAGLHALFSPGLFGTVRQAGAVLGRFVPGYWMGPGLITATAQVLGRFNPGTYLQPDALLTLAGSVARRLIPAQHLAAQIAAVGAVAGRFVQGFFLSPNAAITAVAQMVGHRVPALGSLLTLRGAVAGLYQRGRQFFVTLRLGSALGRAVAWTPATSLRAVGRLVRTISGAGQAATLPLAALVQAGRGFFGTLSATLDVLAAFEAARARVLAALLGLAGAPGPHQVAKGRSATGALSARLLRAMTGAGQAASIPLQVLLQVGHGIIAPGLGAQQTLIAAFVAVRGRVWDAVLTLGGGMGPAQVLRHLTAVLRAAGGLGRDSARALPGAALAVYAALPKVLALAEGAFAAALGAAAGLVPVRARLLDAVLAVSALVDGLHVPALAGLLHGAGALARLPSHSLAALLAGQGQVGRQVAVGYSAAVGAAVQLGRAITRVLSAPVQGAGTLLGQFVPGVLVSGQVVLAAVLQAAQPGADVFGFLRSAAALRLYQSAKGLSVSLAAGARVVTQYLFTRGDSWQGGGAISTADTQGWRGGGTTSRNDSRSWQGGGRLGALDARSWQGGGYSGPLDAGGWRGGGYSGPLDTGSWAGGARTGAHDAGSWAGGSTTAARDAGAWSGGVTVGTINVAHTIGYNVGGTPPNLGGNVNAVPLWLTSGAGNLGGQRAYGGPGGFAFGTYVKMPAYTANGTVLWDLYLGSVGYTRCSIGNNGMVKAELNYTDVNVCSTSLTATSGSFVVPLGQWVWIWARQFASGTGSCGDGNVYMAFQVGWNALGTQGNSAPNTGNWCCNFNVLYWGQLGVGVPVTPSTPYDPFPNTPGYEMSKFRYAPSGNPAYSPPTIDAPAGSYGIVYNVRQPAGAASSLVDTGGQWHGTPGSQGLTVYADGPFP